MNKSVVSVSVIVVMLVLLTGLYYEVNLQEHQDFAHSQEKQLQVAEQVLMKNTAKETSLNSDSIDWISALLENTPVGYRLYLEKHTNGAHAEDAREMLEVFGRARIVDTPKDSGEVLPLNDDSLSIPTASEIESEEPTEKKKKKNVEPCEEPDTIH